MKVIKQSWDWLQKPGTNALKLIEAAGRTCYKSEDKIDDTSAEKFIRMIVSKGHETVIEHVNASIKLITNRGVTHELVRHRLASFSQESTRYVRYAGDMEFIKPIWFPDMPEGSYIYKYQTESLPTEQEVFIHSCLDSELYYQGLLNLGQRPEQAREVLPNSLKTEIVMTANLREWRHVFKMRCQKAAHPQIRALMLSVLKGFNEAIPVVYEDLVEQYIE